MKYIARYIRYSLILILVIGNYCARKAYSENEKSENIEKKIVLRIRGLNQETKSYKAICGFKVMKLDKVVREEIIWIFYSQQEGKIKSVLVNSKLGKEVVLLYDIYNKVYSLYQPQDNVLNYVRIDKLEKDLNKKIPRGYFITDINDPFSKVIVDELQYVGMEEVEAHSTYHFKYRDADFWIGVEDGFLYKKKSYKAEGKVLFELKKLWKGVYVSEQELGINCLEGTLKIDVTEQWYRVLKNTIP